MLRGYTLQQRHDLRAYVQTHEQKLKTSCEQKGRAGDMAKKVLEKWMEEQQQNRDESLREGWKEGWEDSW
jgi:hypothetical protein